MTIKAKYNHILDECIETISNCSIDSSNQVSLVDDINEVINFDNVTKKYSELNFINHNVPQSLDSLYINDNLCEIFFIEFKNKKKIDKVDIKNKIYGSVYILMDIFDLTTDFIRANVKFILVYKENDKQDEAYKNIVLKAQHYAQSENIRFNMGEHKNIFKEVYTYTSEEFKSKFIDKYFSIIL